MCRYWVNFTEDCYLEWANVQRSMHRDSLCNALQNCTGPCASKASVLVRFLLRSRATWNFRHRTRMTYRELARVMLEAEVSLDGQGKLRARDWEWTGVSAGKACAPEWGSSARGSPQLGEHLFILGRWLIRWGPPRGGGPSAFLRYLQWVSSKGSLTDAPRTTPGQASAHCRTPSGRRVRYTLTVFNNEKQTKYLLLHAEGIFI